MLISSDAYNAPVCQYCGLIGGITTSSGKKGGRVYTCQGCKSSQDPIKSVTVPYASKLLLQELMSMGIKPKLSVKEKD